MLNSCSIAFAKEINKVGVENVISQLKPYAKENGITEDRLREELKTFYSEFNSKSRMDYNEGIRHFFRTEQGLNLTLLRAVKQNVRDLVLSEIFGGDPVFTNGQLDSRIQTLIEDNKDDSDQNPGLVYEILTKKNFSGNPREIAQYLLGNHFSLLVKTWLSDFLTQSENGKYEFVVKTQVREDYNTDAFEDKPAEMPNIVELLLSSTDIYDFYNFSLTKNPGEIIKGSQKLNRNVFFYAVRHVVSTMPQKDFVEFVKNPLYIFDYVLSSNRDDLTGFKIDGLAENVIASFAKKWLFNIVVENDGVKFKHNNFYKQMLENSTANSSNVIHMLAATINKYTDNIFLDTSLNTSESGDLSIISDRIDSNTLLGQPLGQLISRVNALKYTDGDADLTSLLRGWEKKSSEEKLSVIRTIFDSPKLFFAETACNSLYKVFNAFNYSDSDNLKSFLNEEGNKEYKDTVEQHVILANRTNVFLPKGSRTNVNGKQLPIYGINSAAADIKLEVVRTILRQEENDALYTGDIARLKRINACQHSWLFKHAEKSPKTVYFSTISSNAGNQLITKEFAQLSVGEAFKLSFETFVNNNLLRIQAITPSDKTRIPFHEFTEDFFKEGNKELSLEEMTQNIEILYKQSILNTIIDVHTALHPELIDPITGEKLWSKSTDVNDWTIEDLRTEIKNLNAELAGIHNIDVLNYNLQKFNEKYGTNKSLARVLDVDHKDDGSQVKIAESNLLYLNEISSPDHWKNLYLLSLKDLKKELPKLVYENKTISEYIADVEQGREYKNSKLYEYFIKSIFAKENILVNVVGLPMAHKGKGSNWLEIDSGKHLTMTKRMVAMTSTSHYCIKNLDNGLPNKINTLTFDSGSLPMFVYSGDTANGSSSEQQHDTWDGIMLGTRAVDNLLKESITDVKPKGNMLKVLLPALSEEKSGAYLAKLAQCTIDNAFLRTFANSDNVLVGATDPMVIMQLSFQNVEFSPESIYKGKLIKGNRLQNITAVYKKVGESILKLSDYNIDLSEDKITAVWINSETGQEVREESDGCNLFNFWKTVLGGEWSCNSNGNYSEHSQDMLTQILIDTKDKSGKQYLKENAVHYFPSLSVQKSTQAPVVKDLHAAQKNKNLVFTVKMDIDRMGIQLDADHVAEDAQIREITQLMNNLAEGAYTPEKTRLIYEKLASLADSLQDFLDLSKVSSADAEDVRIHFGKIFQPRIRQIFADPTLDVLGLANEIASAIKEYDAEYKVAHGGESLLVPISDRQVLSKYHTTVGSMLNKYIARKWTGRGDVLAPSVNLCMKYHWGGVDYFVNDWAYDYDKSDPMSSDKWKRVPIKQLLREKVWINGEVGTNESQFTEYFKTHHRIEKGSGTEIMPEDVLYRVDPVTGKVTVEVVNYHSNSSYFVDPEGKEKFEGFDKMMKIAKEIDSGVQYYRAIDLPQNLRSKRVFANVSWESIHEFEDPDTGVKQTSSVLRSKKIGIYHFQTYKMLQLLGKLIDKKPISEEDMTSLKNYVQNHSNSVIRGRSDALDNLNKTKLYDLKKAVQYYFSRELLPELSKKFVSKRLAAELNKSIFNNDFRSIPTGATVNVEMFDDEKFTTNNYSHIYGLGINLSKILQKKEMWFKEALYKKFGKTLLGNTELTLYSYQSNPINVSSDSSLITTYKLHEVEPEVDDRGYVLSSGKRTFKLPKNCKLYSDNNGTINVIITDDTNLQNVIAQLISQKHFFAYRKGQISEDIELSLSENNMYELFEEDVDNEPLFDSLAKRQYDSFKEALRSLQARIPSQSLSFAMNMLTVGFLPWDTNITMVANSNVFIEGSDFDIDKVYSIMFHLNEMGLIDGVNDRNVIVTDNAVSDHPELGFSVEELEINNGIWELTTAETDEEFELKLQALINRTIELLSIRPSTNSTIPNRVVGSDIRIDRTYLNNLAVAYIESSYPEENWKEYINVDVQKELEDLQGEIEYIIDRLIKRVSDISKLDYTKEGDMAPVQNTLLLQMMGVFDDLSTLVATTTPTTMFPLKNTISDIPLGKELRNHHNFMTDFNVNKTAYTGKKDVGIAATGQKSLMGITQYYSTLYSQNKNLAHEFSFEIPISWQTYDDNFGNTIELGKIFRNFVLPGQKLNLATIEFLVQSKVLKPIDGGGWTFYNNRDKKTYVINIGDVLDITSATDINSAFISAATDNAKEMLLDSLNASQEVLPAFVFGVSKGVPLDLLTVMFTDKLIPFMLNKLRGNIFDGTPAESSMASLLSSEKKIETLIEEYLEMESALDITYEESREKHVEEIKQKLSIYKLFFDGASDMRTIGGTLSINGGIDVHNGASVEWMMRIQNGVNASKPKGAPDFSIEEFLFADLDRRMEICDIYRGDKSYTILDILTTVPNYAAMCKVPYLYKMIIESTSKDMEILHRHFKTIAENNVFKTLKMEQLPNALRIINQVKIFEFLRELDFVYFPEFIYPEGYNEAKNNEFQEVRTSTPEGLFSLKKYIEDKIISVLKTDYSNNAFVNNLAFNSIFLPLFNRSMEYYGSKINLGDKQFEDSFIEIKLDYDKISSETIEGHTVGEWMFLYDLLVHHHNIGGTSLTMCFGSDINIMDSNNLILKWIEFINRWDASTNTIRISELYKNPDLDKINSTSEKTDFVEYQDDSMDYMGEFFGITSKVTRGWSDPTICPLFAKFEDRFENFSPINTSLLLEAFSRGKIFVTLC